MNAEWQQLPSRGGADAAHAVAHTRPVIQTKLRVGAVADPLELEADRMAALVMRDIGRPLDAAGVPGTRIRRSPSAPLPAARSSEPSGTRIRRASPAGVIGAAGGEVDDRLDATIRRSRGGGRPLDDPVRARMERGFGVGFSAVRVHTGGSAASINRSMRSTAATTGSDIFFSDGAYDPTSSSGQRLLAHELTHVVQQGGASAGSRVQRLYLGQAKRDIDEDQMTLKQEYVSARAEQRNDDLAAIMKMQTGTAVRPEAIMMAGPLEVEVPEEEIADVPAYTQPIATALYLEQKNKDIADRFEAEYVPHANPALSPRLMADLRALGCLKIHAQVGRTSAGGGNSMQYWFRVGTAIASMGEWHVHWNAKGQAGSPGWKKGMKGAKTETGDEMRRVLGDLWGVVKNSGNGNWV